MKKKGKDGRATPLVFPLQARGTVLASVVHPRGLLRSQVVQVMVVLFFA